MAAKGNRSSKFRLVQVDGYTERELYEAENLEQMLAYLGQKEGAGGGRHD